MSFERFTETCWRWIDDDDGVLQCGARQSGKVEAAPSVGQRASMEALLILVETCLMARIKMEIVVGSPGGHPCVRCRGSPSR